ncbi:MAG: UDP-glucose 4-epimerase GalE [Patescibacteria group bacterium]|nr:MAG: UDP-glucose 4-epimerase GalE [Patescibacteria group bacterium]
MRFLVTGGAGFIGSFMTKRLLDDGHEVVVLDSLERGTRDALDQRASFIEGNLLDTAFVRSIFASHTFDGVFHFAAYISMKESMERPGAYFSNNILGTVTLLDCMVDGGVNKLIFSSTAGVYGNPTVIPIPEDHPKNPENPYGESKLMVERILAWYQKIHHLRYVVLRYFNAAGAALDGSMGEDHHPETHIIPQAIQSLINKKPFFLYGDDYDTPDGTCIRDYIHVIDLVDAHIRGFEKISKDEGGYIYNVGTGRGYSNKEVIEMVEKVANEKLDVHIVQRRPGDADRLVADVRRIKEDLGFVPRYSDLYTIVSSAWKWHNRS